MLAKKKKKKSAQKYEQLKKWKTNSNYSNHWVTTWFMYNTSTSTYLAPQAALYIKSKQSNVYSAHKAEPRWWLLPTAGCWKIYIRIYVRVCIFLYGLPAFHSKRCATLTFTLRSATCLYVAVVVGMWFHKNSSQICRKGIDIIKSCT